jgi:hypothetical protein
MDLGIVFRLGVIPLASSSDYGDRPARLLASPRRQASSAFRFVGHRVTATIARSALRFGFSITSSPVAESTKTDWII